MVIIVDTYTFETYNILDVQEYRLKDKEGIYWYPLSSFFKNILFRVVPIQKYRDDETYNKYMKVITYRHPKSINDVAVKTWFINTEGMYLILTNFTVSKHGGTRKISCRSQKFLWYKKNK